MIYNIGPGPHLDWRMRLGAWVTDHDHFEAVIVPQPADSLPDERYSAEVNSDEVGNVMFDYFHDLDEAMEACQYVIREYDE